MSLLCWRMCPKDHIDIRISHPGSKAQYKGDTRNHAVQDPSVYVVFGTLMVGAPRISGRSLLNT